MANNALYSIFASKCFSLAHTMVIYSELVAKSQNTILEQKGFRINHNNPKTWKYFLNISGEYHEADKLAIGELNGDGHPYMRIKVAGDNQPILVDFTKSLVSGDSGDYTLAAEYSYGSEYYNELIARYPGFETLVLGILNPIDLNQAVEAVDGDVLYCGGYYRKRLPGLKELYGFEQRDDVKIDAEFLIEEWEQDIIFELQDYIKLYLKRWMIPDFQANHTFFSAVMTAGLMGGLITNIHKFRLGNRFTYASHSYHVREFINSHGYLGEYVDALTREQSMYLYHNMKWLSSNKGKDKVLTELINNLLTPAGIPLVAYNIGHDNWTMQSDNELTPQVEFKKEYLNLDPLSNDVGSTTLSIVKKEEFIARDNGLYPDEQVRNIESASKHSQFSSLKSKVLESDFTEQDMNVFFNLEEFQFYQWLYAVGNGTYRGSIFVSHPITGGRLQLTPLTAMILLIYAYTKGYYGYELEKVPPMVVRNIPKNKLVNVEGSSPYPTDEDLWENSNSVEMTQAKIESLKAFPQPNHNFTSATDFYQKTSAMFETLETRRGLAAAESDIFANADMELMVAKFYHNSLELPPLSDLDYRIWLNNIGLDETKLERANLRALADELMLASLGVSDSIKKSTERMHEAIINIVRFFLSYTVQLVSRFTKTSSRMYGLKTLRMSINREDYLGVSKWDIGLLTFIKAEGHVDSTWHYYLNDWLALHPESVTVGESYFPLIELVTEQSMIIEHTVMMDFGGFNMSEPDPNDPDYAYADPDTIKGSIDLITPRLADINDLVGQTLKLELSPLTVSFLDTYGLKELDASDFDFNISIEI